MDWKEMEHMTVVRLREEALKYPDKIQGVRGKTKEQLMEELARILGIEKPHLHLSDKVAHTKGNLKKKIRALKHERDHYLEEHDHKALHQVRRQIHDLKHKIRKIEQADVKKQA